MTAIISGCKNEEGLKSVRGLLVTTKACVPDCTLRVMAPCYVVHRHHSWVDLLVNFLPWKLEWHL